MSVAKASEKYDIPYRTLYPQTRKTKQIKVAKIKTKVGKLSAGGHCSTCHKDVDHTEKQHVPFTKTYTVFCLLQAQCPKQFNCSRCERKLRAKRRGIRKLRAEYTPNMGRMTSRGRNSLPEKVFSGRFGGKIAVL